MELRRLAILMAFVMLAVSQCTEARHITERRDADYGNYDELGTEVDNGATVKPETPATMLTNPSSFNVTIGDTIVLPCNVSPDETTVKPKTPATMLTNPSSFNVTIGDTIVLPCNVSQDATVVQWFKDNKSYFIGKFMTSTYDSRFSIAPNSEDLVIQDVNVLDSGVYRCETVSTNAVAVNHVVMVLQSPKIIKTTVKPETPATMLTNPSSFNVTIGDTIVLPCNVSQDATFVQWFKDNKSYFIGKFMTSTYDSRFSIAPNSEDLVIQDVNVLDSGVYRCETVSTNAVAVNHVVMVLQSPKIIMYRGSGSNAHSFQPTTTAVVPTILM